MSEPMEPEMKDMEGFYLLYFCEWGRAWTKLYFNFRCVLMIGWPCSIV